MQNWGAFGEDVGRKVHRAYTTTSPWGWMVMTVKKLS